MVPCYVQEGLCFEKNKTYVILGFLGKLNKTNRDIINYQFRQKDRDSVTVIIFSHVASVF
jgi:hypothetical protein